ncbi:MAG TPA: hypothetical protein VLF18_01940 [Tahibacter sp.]|uniref:hypothetical protein n=1 Tax=Tahibacter sp. TaxID=2056211 RepID=UPI002CDD6D10|nr:hypothetical protein [Tahibacter sp.]HSX58937.1 hypothetical protein [Tahibacter sp.]
MNTRIRLSTAALLLGLTLSPFATADEVSVETNTGAVPVPVGPLDAEFISKTISVRGARTLVISYSAECQVERGHVEYDIVVNRSILNVTSRQVAPTNDSLSALCSNDGDTTESNLRAKTVGATVACTVTTPDSYTVRVRGHVESPSLPGPGAVDDQSLVIVEHPFSSGIAPCIFELPGTTTSGG